VTHHADSERVARRVVLTGLGVVSCIGRGADEFLEGLRRGASGARPITAFDTTGFSHAQGCQVPDPEQPDNDLGRAAQFAVDAAQLAVADAGLTPAILSDMRVTVAIGTTDGESRDLDDLVGQQCRSGPADMDPVIARRVQPVRMSAAIARDMNLEQAEVLTIPTACSAGNYAIGYGYDAVRLGESDIALVGGADALCRKTFTGFYRLGTIAPDVCRPFDADRQGILTGEGAGVLVLEPLGRAQARGARIYAEVLGYGLACDAVHPVAPDDSGVARCIGIALDRAGVAPDEVDLVSAHGTGTRANDVTEYRALKTVFGEDLPRTISIKSMIGHSMGAASALGAVASALSLRHQFIPPTINHRRADPECPLDCVPNHSVTADLSVVANNGLAFGGNNAVLVLGKSGEARCTT
jgi:3-oxoacyl-[acyl-carrier-protein] synthase II